jgi:ATP-dependent protease ClpP protease subunit
MIKAALVLLLALASPRYDASLFGPLNAESLSATYNELAAAPEGARVRMRIASPGGEAIPTLIWIEMAQDLKAARHLHVTCVGSVLVASAAALVLESAVCDERELNPGTILLFHQAYVLTEIDEDQRDELRALNRALAWIIGPRVGMSPDAYLAWTNGRDRWLAADIAVGLGFADRLTPPVRVSSGVAPRPAH